MVAYNGSAKSVACIRQAAEMSARMNRILIVVWVADVAAAARAAGDQPVVMAHFARVDGEIATRHKFEIASQLADFDLSWSFISRTGYPKAELLRAALEHDVGTIFVGRTVRWYPSPLKRMSEHLARRCKHVEIREVDIQLAGASSVLWAN